jgi:hypothetical protein
MPRLSFPQRAAALALAALLSGSLQSLWNDLWSHFWPVETLDEGCHLDPSGGCATGASQAPPVQIDAGCHLDPSGGCTGGS